MLKRKRGNLQPSQSSLVLHLAPILTLRQIIFPYTFINRAGISGNSAQKMLNGEAVQINFRQLTALCIALNCMPNDLYCKARSASCGRPSAQSTAGPAGAIGRSERFLQRKKPGRTQGNGKIVNIKFVIPKESQRLGLALLSHFIQFSLEGQSIFFRIIGLE